MVGINNKDKLVFTFHNCTVIEPGFTEFIPKFKGIWNNIFREQYIRR